MIVSVHIPVPNGVVDSTTLLMRTLLARHVSCRLEPLTRNADGIGEP